MPFAPTRNNRVAPRKRTLTSPTPTVKDGMVRRRRPVSVSGDVRVASRLAPPIPSDNSSDKTSPTRYEKKLVRRQSRLKPPVGTPMSAPSVKTGTIGTPRPQMRLNATTITTSIKAAKKPKRSR